MVFSEEPSFPPPHTSSLLSPHFSFTATFCIPLYSSFSVLLRSCSHFSSNGTIFLCLTIDVFSCSFSKSTSEDPVIDFLHYSTCAGDLKDTFVWWSLGERLVSIRSWTCSRLHNVGEASSCQAAGRACTKLCTFFNAENRNVCDAVHKDICSILLTRNTGLTKILCLRLPRKHLLNLSSFWYSPISWLMHLSRVSASPICSTYCVVKMALVFFFPFEIRDVTMDQIYNRYHVYKV